MHRREGLKVCRNDRKPEKVIQGLNKRSRRVESEHFLGAEFHFDKFWKKPRRYFFFQNKNKKTFLKINILFWKKTFHFVSEKFMTNSLVNPYQTWFSRFSFFLDLRFPEIFWRCFEISENFEKNDDQNRKIFENFRDIFWKSCIFSGSRGQKISRLHRVGQFFEGNRLRVVKEGVAHGNSIKISV